MVTFAIRPFELLSPVGWRRERLLELFARLRPSTKRTDRQRRRRHLTKHMERSVSLPKPETQSASTSPDGAASGGHNASLPPCIPAIDISRFDIDAVDVDPPPHSHYGGPRTSPPKLRLVKGASAETYHPQDRSSYFPVDSKRSANSERTGLPPGVIPLIAPYEPKASDAPTAKTPATRSRGRTRLLIQDLNEVAGGLDAHQRLVSMQLRTTGSLIRASEEPQQPRRRAKKQNSNVVYLDRRG